MEDAHLAFEPFRLDLANQRLWREGEAVQLSPKAFAVLAYLVEHPGQLVTKQQLFQAVWPEQVVSDAALAVCVCEIRKALSDDAKAPGFIQTVHRRGVCFIGTLKTLGDTRDPFSVNSLSPLPNARHAPVHTRCIVGRQAELDQLQAWWQHALSGERQVVFVTGEIGIGKTTLLEAFSATARTHSKGWIGYGQCIEQPGQGEAYLTQRLVGHALPPRLAHILHQRTDGTPLFMVTLVDALLQPNGLGPGTAQRLDQWPDLLLGDGLPMSMQKLVEQQLGPIAPEAQKLLKAASVVGVEFSAAAVAAAVQANVEDIENVCEALVEQHRVLYALPEPEKEPDGTVGARYRFTHSMYQEVLYHRVSVGCRARFRQRIQEGTLEEKHARNSPRPMLG